jgi:thioredoxin 1
MSKPVAVTDSSFAQDVLSAPGPVLVDFWAEWCAPCRMIAPILEQLAAEQGDGLKVVKLDVDQNPRVPNQYGVQGIPTLILFRNGEPVERIVGFLPKPALLNRLQKHLGRP